MKKKMTFQIVTIFSLCLLMIGIGFWSGKSQVKTISTKNIAGQMRTIASEEEIAPPRYFSCSDIYALNAKAELEKRLEVKQASQSLGTSGFLIGLISVNPALLVASVSGGFIGSTLASLRSREEKVMLLKEEGSRLYNKLLKQAQKIAPSILEENIKTILEDGFISGHFCKDYPKLMSKRQVRAYVLDKVEKGSY